jgi:phenylalanine-4-hydroxylase
MAVGASIVSVFNGPADIGTFEDQLYVSPEQTHQPSYSGNDYAYHALFAKVREIREQIELVPITSAQLEELENIFNQVLVSHKKDWLCALEILEIIAPLQDANQFSKTIRTYLEKQKTENPTFKKLITDGLAIIDAKLIFQ